jgi:hypothetical protein
MSYGFFEIHQLFGGRCYVHVHSRNVIQTTIQQEAGETSTNLPYNTTSYPQYIIFHAMRDSSVSNVMAYGLDGWRFGVRLPARLRDFSLFYSVQTGSWAYPGSYTVNTGSAFLRVTRQGRETDHWLTSSVEVESGGAIPPLRHRSSPRDAWLSKHKDNFAFLPLLLFLVIVTRTSHRTYLFNDDRRMINCRARERSGPYCLGKFIRASYFTIQSARRLCSVWW